jgi:hypothetical protein
MYAIKADVSDPRAESFVFRDQKTMYGGKEIAPGDTIFIFASENEGGSGLVATGIVASAEPTPRKPGLARQTPRVSINVQRTAHAKRRLGRSELKPFFDWDDGRPRRSSTSSSIVKPQTRSSASRTQRRDSSAGSSSAGVSREDA